MRLTQAQAARVRITDALLHQTISDCVRLEEDARASGSFVSYRTLAVLDLHDTVRALTARAEQAEKDRDALAAVIRAWGQHDISDPMVRGECYRELQERLTDASGALQRAKGGA